MGLTDRDEQAGIDGADLIEGGPVVVLDVRKAPVSTLQRPRPTKSPETELIGRVGSSLRTRR